MTTPAKIVLGFLLTGFICLAGSYLYPLLIPKPVPSKPKPAVTYHQIWEAHNKMTSAQWGAYAASLPGSPMMNQTGWVVDVKAYGPICDVILDTTPPFPLLPNFNTIKIPNQPANSAMALRRGERVHFSGWIARVDTYLNSPSVLMQSTGASIQTE